MSSLTTSPSRLDIATADQKYLTLDLTRVLKPGVIATSPSCVLTDLENNVVVTMDETPTVVNGGKGIQILIEGDILTPLHMYRLDFIYTADSGQILSNDVEIVCPR